MSRTPSRAPALLLGFLLVFGGEASSQTTVVGPGSTPQGDMARGEGVFLQGLGWYELNDAKAMALNFETWRKMEQWNRELQADFRRSYNVEVAQKNYRTKKLYEEAQRKHEEREMQLRTKPNAEDIRKGDALNALLTDLSDPTIQPSSWRGAQVPLPEDISIRSLAMRFAPKQDARGSAELSRGLIALGRLDLDKGWPEFIPEGVLAAERRSYQATFSKIREQCLAGRLDSKTVLELDAAVKKLQEKAAADVPKDRNFRNSAVAFFRELEEATRMFDPTTYSYAKEMIADTNRHEAHTVGELLAFMRKYRLLFAKADAAPGGEEMYRHLYQLLLASSASGGAGSEAGAGIGGSQYSGRCQALPASLSRIERVLNLN